MLGDSKHAPEGEMIKRKDLLHALWRAGERLYRSPFTMPPCLSAVICWGKRIYAWDDCRKQAR